MKINVEVTDTFGGEANYAWVNRTTFEFDEEPSQLTIVEMTKRFAGLTGQQCDVDDYGDTLTIRPIGKNAPCIVCFVSFDYDEVLK